MIVNRKGGFTYGRTECKTLDVNIRETVYPTVKGIANRCAFDFQCIGIGWGNEDIIVTLVVVVLVGRGTVGNGTIVTRIHREIEVAPLPRHTSVVFTQNILGSTVAQMYGSNWAAAAAHPEPPPTVMRKIGLATPKLLLFPNIAATFVKGRKNRPTGNRVLSFSVNQPAKFSVTFGTQFLLPILC